jgi:hypothetical protein
MVAHVLGKRSRELLEVPQRPANVHRAIVIQQHAEQRLCAARILDRLRGEEVFIGRAVVKRAVLRPVLGPLLARRVLEQEDDAVDGAQLAQAVGVEADELFELDVFGAEVLEQVGEDALRHGRQYCLFQESKAPLGLSL